MSLADSIIANFGVPSPGAVNDKLIAYFKNIKTGNGSPVGASMGPGFYWDLTNYTLYTNPNADNTSWVVFGNGTYAPSAVTWGGVHATIAPSSATSGPGVGWNITRDATGESLGFFWYDRGTLKWTTGIDSATDDFVILEDVVAGKDLFRVASSSQASYDGGNFVMGAGVSTPSANTRLQIISETGDQFLADILVLTAQRTNAVASSVFAGAAGIPSGAVLLVADTTTTRAQITPRGWAAFGQAYAGRSNVGGVEVNRALTIETGAPPAWVANHLYVVGEVYQNAGTVYRTLTQYISGATFGATDTTNNAVVNNPSPTLDLVDFASGTHGWSLFTDILNSYRFTLKVDGGNTPLKFETATATNSIYGDTSGNLHLVASGKGLGFFSTSLNAVQQTVTGALSTVTDAAAKAVLTSLITALGATKYNLILDGTT